jgi:hypothetical protein
MSEPARKESVRPDNAYLRAAGWNRVGGAGRATMWSHPDYPSTVISRAAALRFEGWYTTLSVTPTSTFAA